MFLYHAGHDRKRKLTSQFSTAHRDVGSPAVDIGTVGIIDEGDPAARQTAENLASALGAQVGEYGSGPVDFLVVGSRPEAPDGKVVLSAKSDYAVEAATYPVLVLPRSTALGFTG